MRRYILLITGLFFFSAGIVQAQNRSLKKVMELTMPKTPKPADDDMCGTRGGGVCWNPVTKKYYAAFCGNMGYPMAVFDVKGKMLSDETLTTMYDIRGIWYNAAVNKIMANCYSEYGWISYVMNSAGIPINTRVEYSGMNQPTEQCVGSYDNKLKQVFFLVGGRVVRYAVKENTVSAVDSVQIHWGRKKAEGPGEDDDEFETNEDYNYTNVIATGIPGSEIGLLNKNLKQVELYSLKDGFVKQVLKLPETATAEPSFNFAFSNGIYWLFDMENRKWVGYK